MQACLADWSAAVVVLLVLLLDVAAETHEEWILVGLLANVLGLAAEVAILMVMGSALAVGDVSSGGHAGAHGRRLAAAASHGGGGGPRVVERAVGSGERRPSRTSRPHDGVPELV